MGISKNTNKKRIDSGTDELHDGITTKHLLNHVRILDDNDASQIDPPNKRALCTIRKEFKGQVGRSKESLCFHFFHFFDGCSLQVLFHWHLAY